MENNNKIDQNRKFFLSVNKDSDVEELAEQLALQLERLGFNIIDKEKEQSNKSPICGVKLKTP